VFSALIIKSCRQPMDWRAVCNQRNISLGCRLEVLHSWFVYDWLF